MNAIFGIFSHLFFAVRQPFLMGDHLKEAKYLQINQTPLVKPVILPVLLCDFSEATLSLKNIKVNQVHKQTNRLRQR